MIHYLSSSCPTISKVNNGIRVVEYAEVNIHRVLMFTTHTMFEAHKSMYTMSSAPKPPREVRRQQAKYGTGSGTIESTARAAAIVKQENALRPYVSSRSSGSSSRDSRAAAGKQFAMSGQCSHENHFL